MSAATSSRCSRERRHGCSHHEIT